MAKSCFDTQKHGFGERSMLFHHCFIANGFWQCWYMENVSFCVNDREISDKIYRWTPFSLREVYCEIHWREYWKFQYMPDLERLPGANGRKDPLRSYIWRQKRSSKTEIENCRKGTTTLCVGQFHSTVTTKFGKHNHAQMALLNTNTQRYIQGATLHLL